MVEVFGAELLEMMHKDVIQRLTERETEFNAEVLSKITHIVKVCYLHYFIRYEEFYLIAYLFIVTAPATK